MSLNSDFNGNEFSSIVMIPFFKIKKEKNIWYVTLLVANQFYEYNFPFQFNDYFIHWESTHQFEVKLQIIQLLAQTTFKKKLDVEEFLKPFDKVSNAKMLKRHELKRSLLKGLSNKFKIGAYNPNSTLFKRITQLSS